MCLVSLANNVRDKKKWIGAILPELILLSKDNNSKIRLKAIETIVNFAYIFSIDDKESNNIIYTFNRF